MTTQADSGGVQAEHGEIAAAVEEMPYGVYIIGSTRDGEPNGMIADWVTQVAFRPHRVAVAFENDSFSLASIRLNNAFTVNLLARGSGTGMALAQHFIQPHRASKVKGRGQPLVSSTYEKLDAVEFTTTKRGCPILEGALMWLDCTAEQFVDVGDHTLVIGHVLDGRVEQSDLPLTSADIPWPYSG
jgi:3-hydroxy-9,10-secoandrosta-1,3,5(10)-triene-9,17-dione monooxygenase reductase component